MKTFKKGNFILSFVFILSLVFSSFSSNISFATTGDGSWETPYTVAQANTTQDNTLKTVQGYIVGQPTATTTVITSNFPNDYAIALADSPTETNTSKMIYVQVSTAFRSTFGLQTNPSLKGSIVKVTGYLTAYFSHTGIINVAAMEKATGTQTIAVTGVTLDKTSASLAKGSTQVLTATVAPVNATNKTFSWASSNSTVATVVNGVVTGNEVGASTITVTTADGGKIAVCNVTVTETTLGDGSWENPYLVAQANTTQNNTLKTVQGYIVGQPTATSTVITSNYPNDYAIALADSPAETNTSKMIYVQVSTAFRSTFGLQTNPSLKGSIVKVTGYLTAYFSHTGIINVTAMEKATGTQTIAVTGVTLDKTSASLAKGSTQVLTATVAPVNATNKTFSWTSSNSTVATVVNGVVTGNEVGASTITVTTADGGKTAICNVTITETNTSPYDSTYYSPAIGKTGESLKGTLNDIIANHTKLSYDEVWDALRYTDEDPNNTNNVILLYTGRSQSKLTNGGDVDDWNREHVFAKSHGDFGTTAGPGTDIHHLRPTDVSVNGARGNLDFDMGGSYNSEATECKSDSDSWEPRDSVKGDVARMIFYMAVRYEGENGELDLELNNLTSNTTAPYMGKLSTLLQWNEQDPVDDFERNRNDVIYNNYQHNRNPFIDHSEWANLIFN
jgi:endonuclease I